MRASAKIFAAILFATASSAALAEAGSDGQDVSPVLTNEAVVREYIHAFNEHDIAAMQSYWAPEIEWIDLSGDKPEIILSGTSTIAEATRSYFAEFHDVRSDIVDIVVAENLVAFVEIATWTHEGNQQSQKALAIYEIQNGLITRFWYISAG